MPSLSNSFSSMFGFADMNTGLSMFGNMALWGFLVLIGLIIFGGGFWWWYSGKVFRHKIIVYGMLGGKPQKKWEDKAKLILIGSAGDKLFYLKKNKRHIPPPTLQSGEREWWYWEREDGELINICLEDIDEKQRQAGAKFVDTDMRMQRLGIEKNLQYRLQKEGFWEKYGQMIINVAFYVIVTMMLIVLFTQWRKTGTTLETVAQSVQAMAEAVKGVNQHEPTGDSSGSGVIPAFIMLILPKLNYWRKRKDVGN